MSITGVLNVLDKRLPLVTAQVLLWAVMELEGARSKGFSFS